MKTPSYSQRVFLDGRPVKNCLSFDMEKGVVKYYELDQDGNIKMEGSKAKIIKAKGKVEVKSMVELIRDYNFYDAVVSGRKMVRKEQKGIRKVQK